MPSSLLSSYLRSFSGLQRNIWVLSVSMLINRSGSMVLMFSSLYLTRDLGFSMETAGIILSFYGIGSVLGSFAGGWLTDRFHHYRIMMVSLIGSGLILFLLFWVESQIGISIVMFMYAFVADVFRPANSSAIGIFSTPENRTRSVSLVRLAVNLGFSIGPAAGGFIALATGIIGYICVIIMLIISLQGSTVLLVNAGWDGISCLLGSLAAYIFLGERLNNYLQYAGIFLIIIGIYLLKIPLRKDHPFHIPKL
jgi:predicted MFS family arabinose efflux permease